MDDMSNVEVEIKTPVFKIIAELNKTEPIEGSHVVLTKAEIPQDESVIYLNPGHAKELPIELVPPSGLYYEEKKSIKDGSTFYAIHAAPKVDELIQNELFKNNDEAKKVLFTYVDQQLGQTTHKQ